MAKAHQIVLKMVKRKSWVGRDKIDIFCTEEQRKKCQEAYLLLQTVLARRQWSNNLKLQKRKKKALSSKNSVHGENSYQKMTVK